MPIKTCLDACRERGYDDAIEYGISVQYARTRQWGEWEIFREFMQNALDEEHYVKGEVPGEYLCRDEPGRTIIYDHGRGISVDNLLLGESRKESWQRGKFGEGMKLAMLGALVSGLRVTIRSRDKLIEPITVPRVYEDREVEILCACVKRGLQPITGTEVTIYGVEMCRRYERYVIQGIEPDPKCLLLSIRSNSREWRHVINKECTDGRGTIYLRDLYVARVRDIFPDVRDSVYSYNLYDVVIDESRKIPSSSTVYYDIRNVLVALVKGAAATPDHPGGARSREILKNIIKQALSTREGEPPYLEAQIYLNPALFTSKELQVIVDIFDELYGKSAVVATTISEFERASYLGLKPIYCTQRLCDALHDIIGTDKRMLAKQMGCLQQVVDVEKSMPEFYEVIKVLEEIGDLMTGFKSRGIKIYYAILDPDMAAQAQKGNIVIINLTYLLDRCAEPLPCVRFFLSSLAHEIAHLECDLCADTSSRYPPTLTDVVGKMFGEAVRNNEILGDLFKNLISAHRRWVASRTAR